MLRPLLYVYLLIFVPTSLVRLGLPCPAPGEESEALTTPPKLTRQPWAALPWLLVPTVF